MCCYVVLIRVVVRSHCLYTRFKTTTACAHNNTKRGGCWRRNSRLISAAAIEKVLIDQLAGHFCRRSSAWVMPLNEQTVLPDRAIRSVLLLEISWHLWWIDVTYWWPGWRRLPSIVSTCPPPPPPPPRTYAFVASSSWAAYEPDRARCVTPGSNVRCLICNDVGKH